MEEQYRKAVITGIENFLKYYNIDFEFNRDLMLDLLFMRFLSRVTWKCKDHDIYILIDEYDKYTNGLLEGDTTLLSSVVEGNGAIKAFYALIKEYMGNGVIDRFFATGICPVDLKVLSGGFNIATTITADFMFNSMLGLTKTEIEELLGEYDKDLKDEKLWWIFIFKTTWRRG